MRPPDIYALQVGSSFDDYAQYAMPVEEYASDRIGSVNAESVKQTTTGEGKWNSENLVSAAKAWQRLFTDGVF